MESVRTPLKTNLTEFLKTNLTKLAVIREKSRQKAGSLSPRSSKITVTKKKERRKRKSQEKERRRRKKAMAALLVFIMATLAGKNCRTQKVHLAITFSKIRLDIVSDNRKLA